MPLTTILGGLQALGAGLSALGQLRAGAQQQRIADVNAQAILDAADENAQLIEQTAVQNAGILDFNSRILEAQGRDALERGYEAETQFRLGVRGLIGSQRTSYAAQGVDVGDGSALEVQADTAYQGALDALQLRLNAAREAWGYQSQAQNLQFQKTALQRNATLQAESERRQGRSQALSSRLGGRYAASAGRSGAASTILGTTASLLQQYQKGKS